MTRPHRNLFHCANCGSETTSESSFGRWIRANPELDSRAGYSVMDQDYWIHCFKHQGNRDFQLLMLVEIKTYSSTMSKAQTDTAWIIDQVTRNRRATPTNQPRIQSGNAPSKVRSQITGKWVYLRAYGVHLLQFSGRGPDDSATIIWDKTPIDLATLTSLLRFDLDPDTLKPMDLRNHHRTPTQQELLYLMDQQVA